MPGVILVGIMSAIMAVFPPLGTESGPQKETTKLVVPDNPQSHRYKIGDVDWKTIEEVTKNER